MTELRNVGNPRVSLMTNTLAHLIIDLDLTLRHERCGNYKVKRLLFKLSHKVNILQADDYGLSWLLYAEVFLLPSSSHIGRQNILGYWVFGRDPKRKSKAQRNPITFLVVLYTLLTLKHCEETNCMLSCTRIPTNLIQNQPISFQ